MTEKSESATMVCGTDRISCFLFLNRYIQDSKRFFKKYFYLHT